MKGAGEPVNLEREPMWLQAAVDQRIAQFKEVVMGRHSNLLTRTNFIVFMLREAGEFVSDYQLDRWNTTCDNCLTYFKPGHPDYCTFFISRTVEGHQISIVGGACKRCLDLP